MCSERMAVVGGGAPAVGVRLIQVSGEDAAGLEPRALRSEGETCSTIADGGSMTPMASGDDERVRLMLNPPHLGDLIREGMEDVGWTVGESAARRNCERGTLLRALNGKAGECVQIAMAVAGVDLGTADHWMCMQAAYELAQARRRHKAGRREPVGCRQVMSNTAG